MLIHKLTHKYTNAHTNAETHTQQHMHIYINNTIRKEGKENMEEENEYGDRRLCLTLVDGSMGQDLA